jgi:hypothetical protein
MFIGYLSSFFIALALSCFYISYAASGVYEQIRKEIEKDTNEKSETLPHSVSIHQSNNSFDFAFTYFTDLNESHQQTAFREFETDISVAVVDIPINKICLSEYYLRPPPAKYHPEN